MIAIAGPGMNIVLAIGLLAGVYMIHYEYPVFLDQPAVIAWIKQIPPAAKAEFRPAIASCTSMHSENPTWEQVEPRVMLSPNQPLDMTIQRGDEIPAQDDYSRSE